MTHLLQKFLLSGLCLSFRTRSVSHQPQQINSQDPLHKFTEQYKQHELLKKSKYQYIDASGTPNTQFFELAASRINWDHLVSSLQNSQPQAQKSHKDAHCVSLPPTQIHCVWFVVRELMMWKSLMIRQINCFSYTPLYYRPTQSDVLYQSQKLPSTDPQYCSVYVIYDINVSGNSIRLTVFKYLENL